MVRCLSEVHPRADCNKFLRCRRLPVKSDPTEHMSLTVNPRIPLSLLEAIRRIDTPQDQVDAEYVQELRNKRLGLSDTVYAQIRRYSDALKRGQRIPFGEAEGLGTLIGRRPDSDELFRSAGLILANDVYHSISATKRGTIRLMPAFISRPMALGELTSVVAKYFGGTLERSGSFLTLRVRDSVTVNGSPKSAGCIFYEEALRELIRLLVNSSGQVDHVHCTQRNEGACEWRADWGTT
jgi:predicted hydrocarbon binding protein